MNASMSAGGAIHVGTVTTFDEKVGSGTIAVATDAGVPVPQLPGPQFPFHCVSLADGSRHIEPGTAVTFAINPRQPGIWEATNIRRVASPT